MVRRLNKDEIDAIVELYATPNEHGLWRSANVIGRMFSTSNVSVLYHLRKHGVAIRSPGETQQGHAYRPIINKPPLGETPPPCKCGCGQLVTWNRSRKQWHKYVAGHYRPHRPYHDRDWLFTEYVVKERSALDIADECDVANVAIYRFLRKFGIEIRTQSETLHATGAMRGKNNPAWKGGVADWDYSHDWKAVANEIRDRDKWTCQLCGEQRKRWNGDLHVHHIDEDKLNNHPHNLISLCPSCHHPLHGDLSIRSKLTRIAVHNSA